MQIIAFTDIHGAYRRVHDIITRENNADVVIIGGDLTTEGSPQEAEEAIKLFRTCGKQILAVLGNMDPTPLEGTMENLRVSINAKGVLVGEVGFFGVSGSPFTPMSTPYEIPEEEISRRSELGWSDVAAARWKIFVPHAPPHNTKLDKIVLGKHVGSTAVRSFIEEPQPDVVICGHIHESRGLDTIGKTQIVNCGQAGKGEYAIIALAENVSIEVRG
jgi:Icc-related predicted phosphoesterase